MISAAIKERTRALMRQVGRWLGRTGITPNALTVIGLALNIVVAAVLAAGYLVAGGLLLLAAGLFDMLDGAVAKATNQTTRFGAFLDSTLDRYSEIVVFFGLLIHLQLAGLGLEAALVYAAAVGSLLVSYARARAESLGFACEVGLLARPERIIVLAAGLVLSGLWSGWLVVALGVLAIFTNVTAVQRILHVWRLQRES